MSLLAEGRRTVPEPVGLYKFVHPGDYVVNDPYEHVGWFYALQTPYLVVSVLPGCNDYYQY